MALVSAVAGIGRLLAGLRLATMPLAAIAGWTPNTRCCTARMPVAQFSAVPPVAMDGVYAVPHGQRLGHTFRVID
jgi:hypothetical protein